MQKIADTQKGILRRLLGRFSPGRRRGSGTLLPALMGTGRIFLAGRLSLRLRRRAEIGIPAGWLLSGWFRPRRRGGLGDVKVKKFLNHILQAELSPIRARRAQWQKDIPGVYQILKRGSEAAQAEAAQTLAQVKRAMRINYFEDGALIQSQVEKYR